MSHVPADPPVPRSTREVSESRELSISLETLAELVALGKVPFPAAHPGLDRDELTRLVLHERRTHLMAYLAGVLARDIRRAQESRHVEDDV
jgi:hypothetical protein